MSSAKPDLLRKKLEVMRRVSFVEKDGKNDFQKYSYVSEAQVVAKIRDAMLEVGLVSTPHFSLREFTPYETQRGDTSFFATVELELELHDVESGQGESIHALGTGTDKGDKAVAKAMTMANKYALLKGFQLQTYDDPEADESTDRDPPRRARRTSPRATPDDAIASVGGDPLAADLCGALEMSAPEIRRLYGRHRRDLVAFKEELAGRLIAERLATADPEAEEVELVTLKRWADGDRVVARGGAIRCTCAGEDCRHAAFFRRVAEESGIETG